MHIFPSCGFCGSRVQNRGARRVARAPPPARAAQPGAGAFGSLRPWSPCPDPGRGVCAACLAPRSADSCLSAQPRGVNASTGHLVLLRGAGRWRLWGLGGAMPFHLLIRKQ